MPTSQIVPRCFRREDGPLLLPPTPTLPSCLMPQCLPLRLCHGAFAERTGQTIFQLTTHTLAPGQAPATAPSTASVHLFHVCSCSLSCNRKNILMWLGCRLSSVCAASVPTTTTYSNTTTSCHAYQSDRMDCLLFLCRQPPVQRPEDLPPEPILSPKIGLGIYPSHRRFTAQSFDAATISPHQFNVLVQLGVLASVRGFGERTSCACRRFTLIGRPRHCSHSGDARLSDFTAIFSARKAAINSRIFSRN